MRLRLPLVSSWDSMSSMAINRRTFLVTSTALLVLTPSIARPGEDDGLPRFLSTAKLADGSHALVIVAVDGRLLREIPLRGRGHDVALSPDMRMAVAFARRPGTFAVAIDLIGSTPPRLFETPIDRHFYGHGVFSGDGRLLYATENDFASARGMLGVYDVAAGFQRIGEIPSHGVGPHDVLLLPDGNTLCVANGGIETHPAAGREKLNLSTMQPSLAFIDRGTGELLAKHELSQDIRHLSIRHLCVDAGGTVWFGGQWEGAMDQSPELIGWARIDRAIRFIEPDDAMGLLLKGYIGSVATTGDRRILAASAPRAGRMLYVDTEHGKVVGETVMPDCCGTAPASENAIAVSSGLGELRSERPCEGSAQSRVIPGVAFDNHMRRLNA